MAKYPIPRAIDLSHWDDVQDGFAGAVRAGIWGIINKCTEGVGSVDKSFEWRIGPAKKAGLSYGAYHFLRPGRIVQQAEIFLEHAVPSNGLLLALDHEDPNVPLKDARLFMETVHDQIGRFPALYSGFLIKEQLSATKVDPFWSQTQLWLAQYSSRPKWPKTWDEPFLIQYSGDGVGPSPHGVPGIKPTGKLDMNHFAGTRAELTQRWAA